LETIRVNDRFLESTGFYELICGKGRLLAHKQLGKKRVMAEVVKKAMEAARVTSKPRKPR